MRPLTSENACRAYGDLAWSTDRVRWNAKPVREREIKLLIDADVELPPLEKLLSGCGSWTTETVVLEAVYFDTWDLRLTRSGVSLRYRSDDGWCVKTPEARDGDVFVRREHAFGEGFGNPPRAAIELVLPWARSETVSEVARITTRRQKTRVCDAGGRLVCEIDDDEVAGVVDGRPPVHFREIEIETHDDGEPHIVTTVAKRLRKAGAGQCPALPKVARVLGDRAVAPPDLPAAPHLDRSSTTTDLVSASIIAAVQSLLDNDPVVRAGEDPEGVHRARVATRRLRSHLHTFRPIVDNDWSESLRAELQWLAEQLGHVRDPDVLLHRLTAKAGELPPDLRVASRALTDRLRVARDRDRAALLDAMRSPRYTTLLDNLVGASQTPRMRNPDRTALAKDSARRLTRNPWKGLRATVTALPRSPSSIELHDVRKQAKRARYAFEATMPVIGKKVQRAGRRLADLQDLLGDQHDAIVAMDWLHSAATDEPNSEVAFAAGALAASFADDERRARRRWPTAWRRVKRAI